MFKMPPVYAVFDKLAMIPIGCIEGIGSVGHLCLSCVKPDLS